MAAQIYLLTIAESDSPNKQIINEIYGCLVNSDDGGADSVKIAEAEAVIQAGGHAIPDGYFDTVQLIGPETAGVMDTDEDVILFRGRGQTEFIA